MPIRTTMITHSQRLQQIEEKRKHRERLEKMTAVERHQYDSEMARRGVEMNRQREALIRASQTNFNSLFDNESFEEDVEESQVLHTVRDEPQLMTLSDPQGKLAQIRKRLSSK